MLASQCAHSTAYFLILNRLSRGGDFCAGNTICWDRFWCIFLSQRACGLRRQFWQLICLAACSENLWTWQDNYPGKDLQICQCFPFLNKFLVSKETVVLRRWERSKQKFGFIKRVDKGEITTVKDLES